MAWKFYTAAGELKTIHTIFTEEGGGGTPPPASLAIPEVVLNTGREFILTDAYKRIAVNATTDQAMQIPPDDVVDFEDGTVIEVYRAGTGNLTITVPSTSTVKNYITNPSNEVNLTGYNANIQTGDTWVRHASAAHDGSWGQRLTMGSVVGNRGVYFDYNPNLLLSTLGIAPLTAVSVGMWVGCTGYAEGARILIEAYQGTTWKGEAFGNYAGGNGVWGRTIVENFVIPADSDTLRLTILSNPASPSGKILDMDSAMLVTGPTLPAYADGSTSGWQWNGTAHASTSQQVASGGTVVLHPPAGPRRISAQYKSATLYKRSSGLWVLDGNLMV